MLNNTVLIGRIVKTPELRETENGKKVTNITVAVTRSFKNVQGEYDVDFIDCVLWSGIAETATEYCKKGDLIAVKGRLQNTTSENEENIKINVLQFIVEKLSFLTSSTKNQEKVSA